MINIPMPFFDYVALYMPAVASRREDPTRRGFWTKRGAWKYIEKREIPNGICRVCGEPDCDTYLCEWEVLRFNKYKKCKSFTDILEAAGHKIEKIWPLEEGEDSGNIL